MDYTDILGKRFGRLVVEDFVRSEPYVCASQRGLNYIYRCRCDCGKVFEAVRRSFLTEHKKSCGCQRVRRGADNGTWTGFGEISGKHWRLIQRHARSRALSFTLTLQEAWALFLQQERKCALTGLPLVMDPPGRRSGRGPTTASLDRIDNAKGYEKGNVQWVHKDVNRMKTDFSQDRFIEVCRAVALRYPGAERLP